MKSLRNLGVLVCAALAVAAVIGTASASASRFEAFNNSTKKNEYPAILNGQQYGGSDSLAFGLFGNSCTIGKEEGFSGLLKGARGKVTPQGMANAQCESFHGPATLAANGCVTVFHLGAETAEGFAGTFDIGGASCTAMTLTYKSPFNCTVTIGPQTGLNAKFKNSGKGDEEATIVEMEAAGLKYSGEGTSADCPKGAHSDGSWLGKRIVKAYKDIGGIPGAEIGLHISPLNPPTGISVSGGNFQAESYPLPIAGGQTKALEFLPSKGSGMVSCASASFGAELTASSSSLNPVSASYGGCTGFGSLKAAINMHSCYYVFQASGNLEIACSKAGDSIEAKIYKSESEEAKCTSTIAPQSHKGLTFTNLGEGSTSGIAVGFAVEGIQTTVTGGLLNCGVSNGTHSDGTLKGSIALYSAE